MRTTLILPTLFTFVIAAPHPQDLGHAAAQPSRLLERAEPLSSTDGYTAPLLLKSAISAPLVDGKDTYMGYKLWTTGTFDAGLCASACTNQSLYNIRHPPKTGAPRTCQFFNTYEVYKGTERQGQYCAMYTQAWNETYAVKKPAAGTTIRNSYSLTNSTNDGLPKSTTLLDAGDFEKQSWGGWSLLVQSQDASIGIESTGKTGYGGYVRIPASDSGYAWLSYATSPLPLQASTQYRFTVDVKFDTAACSLLVQSDNANFISVPQQSGQPVGTWTTLTGTFVASQFASIFIIIDCANVNVGIIHFDNIVLRQESTTVYNANTPAIGPNLVRDPGFESGTLVEYQTEQPVAASYRIEPVPGSTNGVLALAIDLNELAEGQPTSSFVFKQTIQGTKKDTVYRISYDIQFDQVLDRGCSVKSSFKTGEATAEGPVIFGANNPYQPGVWNTVATAAPAQAANTDLIISLSCLAPAPALKFKLDNILVLPLSA